MKTMRQSPEYLFISLIKYQVLRLINLIHICNFTDINSEINAFNPAKDGNCRHYGVRLCHNTVALCSKSEFNLDSLYNYKIRIVLSQCKQDQSLVK